MQGSEPSAGRLAFFSFIPVVDQDGCEAPRRSRSCEIAGLQGGVGLVDNLELLFGRLVAAMGVGVVRLDQSLVTRLEADHREGRFYFENGERLLARRQGAVRRVGSVIAVGPAALPGCVRMFTEHAERIADSRRVGGTVTVAERPSRALPHRVVADLRLDLG